MAERGKKKKTKTKKKPLCLQTTLPVSQRSQAKSWHAIWSKTKAVVLRQERFHNSPRNPNIFPLNNGSVLNDLHGEFHLKYNKGNPQTLAKHKESSIQNHFKNFCHKGAIQRCLVASSASKRSNSASSALVAPTIARVICKPGESL
jgi:hypothetical protein